MNKSFFSINILNYFLKAEKGKKNKRYFRDTQKRDRCVNCLQVQDANINELISKS